MEPRRDCHPECTHGKRPLQYGAQKVIRLSNAASRDSRESVLGRATGTMPFLLLSVVKITLPWLKGEGSENGQ